MNVCRGLSPHADAAKIANRFRNAHRNAAIGLAHFKDGNGMVGHNTRDLRATVGSPNRYLKMNAQRHVTTETNA